MVVHMNITIEISDAVLDEAKALAQREGTTLDVLAEDALRQIVERRAARALAVDAALEADGLRPVPRERIWDHIRDAFDDQEV
jgi:predicted transcriptional regulator